MPARNTRFRALTDEFRRFLDRRSAWPPVKQFPKALDDKGGGRKADITAMKAGGTVAEKYVIALVELLWKGPTLDAFLAEQGKGERGGRSVEEVAVLVAGPVEDHAAPPPTAHADDWFTRGLDGLVGLFTGFSRGTLIREGTACRHEGDVRTAADMILATTGRRISGDAGLSADAAIERGEGHMRIGRSAYQDHAIGLWRAAPWSVAFAVVDRMRVACSVVLPLTESDYGEIRAGRLSPHDCSARDLAVPSRTLLIEGTGEKPEPEYPHVGKRSAQQIRTMFLQVAHLSLSADPAGLDESVRLLGFAGSKKNEARLRRYSYRPTGTKLAGFDLELMELDERHALFVQLVLGHLRRRLR